tara:strand:+ start:70 stop:465 length:396 start_codon:yes stop_codon:yes gene_type:complete
MAKMIHSMIRVLNEKKSLQFYQDVLNLREKRRLSFASFALIYLGNDETDFELELTVNFNQEEAYQMGNGYGHLAFAANNIGMLHQNALSCGYQPNDIKEFYNGDELVAKFFFINDPDGYSIEVIERSEVYR